VGLLEPLRGFAEVHDLKGVSESKPRINTDEIRINPSLRSVLSRINSWLLFRG
jgi:hypothetical protein